jgi:hypothetical protein
MKTFTWRTRREKWRTALSSKYLIQIQIDVSYRIATRLKRQITQLKKDRIIGGGGNLYSKIDDQLDNLIEENVKLQDEEQRLI